MNIKKKILGITIAPVIILGLISMFLTTTMVRSAMLEEIEEALRGTAAATLAAYDQNTGGLSPDQQWRYLEGQL